MSISVVVLDAAPDVASLGARRAPQVHRLHRDRTLAWAHAVAPGKVWISGTEALPQAELIPAALDLPVAQRVESASALVLLADTPGLLLVVGVRCWALSAIHARDAVSDLTEGGCDLSVGPATGGGLYLLGARELGALRLAAGAFGELGLGGAFAAANEAGLSIGLLRSERELVGAEGVQALICDPLTAGALHGALA